MNNPTSKIHTVSRCLQRRFVDPSTQWLAMVDLISGRHRPKSTAGIGYVPDYIIWEPDRAELVWQQVENRLPDAFTAVQDGTVFAPERLHSLLILGRCWSGDVE
jgi:hypothetical protein